MGKDINLDNILSNLEFMKKFYDVVRIIDPIRKKILKYIGGELEEETISCYKAWNRNTVCQNCVGMRAYNEKENLIKIEYDGKKIILVTASLLEIENRTIVLELLRDITNKGIVEDIQTKSVMEIANLFNMRNDLIVKDPLTKVYNKRFINERLPYDLVDTLIKEQYLTVFIADIDFFKNVNDTYGHVAGDHVLHEFAQKLSSSVKEKDGWVARYGGEEFLICLRDNDMENSYLIAEEMRKAVEKMDIEYKDELIKITASFGGITLYNTKMDLEAMIDKADDNLYEAKNSGRNKTVMTRAYEILDSPNASN